MTAREILDEWLLQTDTTNFKEGHYFVIEQAMQEYAKVKCQELLEIVADKAEPTDFGYAVSRYSIMNAVDLEDFCS